MQVRGWAQDMCLNRARQRRRHRRALEDWAHLYEHALAADVAPGFLSWLPTSGWQWPLDSGDPQVGRLGLPYPTARQRGWGRQLGHLTFSRTEAFSGCCLFGNGLREQQEADI